MTAGDTRMTDHRIGFLQALEHIDRAVSRLFAIVVEDVAAATEGFLAGDVEIAGRLRDDDRLVDGLYHEVEQLVQVQFALQAPVARDMRFLLTALRIVPELERSADLAEHIATRGGQHLAASITPRARGLVGRMGEVAHGMWREASEAWCDRATPAGERLGYRDDELDELHVALNAEAASGQLTVPVAMEMALVSRFYERLGDHAVHIAARIDYLITGIDAAAVTG